MSTELDSLYQDIILDHAKRRLNAGLREPFEAEVHHVAETQPIHDAFLEMMRGKGQVEPDEDVLEDAIAFAGAAKLTARIKCALLSWMAFQDALVRAQEDSDA